MKPRSRQIQPRQLRRRQAAEMNRFRRNPVFSGVDRGFWRRFQHRWGQPLRLLEMVISASEYFGADPRSAMFKTMDETYWRTLRSLHSRTCLHARAVLALLHNGLVDPATAQWRVCHETATIGQFIAINPEMASRYMRYSPVNKHRLAKALFDRGHPDAPTKEELDNLGRITDQIEDEFEQAYGRPPASNPYAWSGLQNFRDIETLVSQSEGNFQLRGEYIHAEPNAGEPLELSDGSRVFPVGPVNLN